MAKEMASRKECNNLFSSCCKIRGEKAINFVAYGGKGCEFCRQFFRRAVVKMNRQDKIRLNKLFEDKHNSITLNKIQFNSIKNNYLQKKN